MPCFPFPLRLPIKEAGVEPRHFRHQSSVHGTGHINRVIVHAIHIARAHGYMDELPAIWAAAHLHDLARRHDGACPYHGEWAVLEALPCLLPLYFRGGVTPRDLPAIVAAVSVHCQDTEIPRDHPAARVTNVLKDADALDRVRLGDLDVSRFRLQLTPELVRFAHYLFEHTGAHCSLEDAWRVSEEYFKGSWTDLDECPYFWNPDEAGVERRDRRLRQARQRPGAVIPHTPFWSPKLSAETALRSLLEVTRSNPDLRAPATTLLDILPQSIAQLRPPAYRLVPFTATRSLAEFQRDNVYKGMWEAGATWHHKFVPNPEGARLTHDLRLFGERASFVTFGVLLDPASPTFENDLITLSKTYGPDVIQWNASILDCATFTLNDSARGPCVLPFDPESWIKAYYLHTTAPLLQPWPRAIMPWSVPGILFWEFQIHRQLTTADVSTVSQPLAVTR